MVYPLVLELVMVGKVEDEVANEMNESLIGNVPKIVNVLIKD